MSRNNAPTSQTPKSKPAIKKSAAPKAVPTPSAPLPINSGRGWLMKSEPDTFSIDDLAQRKNQIEPWNGVRNYQARNFMRDDMREGDRIFFYHSNCEEPGIVGLARVASPAYPDATQWDPKSPYFDPKSTQESPRWQLVDVQLVRKFTRNISLTELRTHEDTLRGLALLARGSRLSVLPVAAEHFDYILALENQG